MVVVCVMAVANTASADTFGSGANEFTIDFVSIGNAGNVSDLTTGYGAVGYEYRIGKYEVTNAQWNAFTAVAAAPIGYDPGYSSDSYWTGTQQPANSVSWYESLQFCNYLTSGDKSKGAYQFSGNNINPEDFLGINRAAAILTYGTVYVLPNENEWYKAAYYKADGSGYSIYANGQDAIPIADNGWNYFGGAYDSPWNVGSGTKEQNGTFDMMGNVFEWNETIIDSSYRGIRGGSYSYYFGHDSDFMISSARIFSCYPYYENAYTGFRIASIPEPATLLLLGLGGVILRSKKAKGKR